MTVFVFVVAPPELVVIGAFGVTVWLYVDPLITTVFVCGGLLSVVVIVFAPPLVVFETVVVTEPSAFLVVVVVVATVFVGVVATRVTLAFEGTESLKFAGGDVTTLVALPGREVVDVVEAVDGIIDAMGGAPDAPEVPGLWVHFANAGAARPWSVDAVRTSQNHARVWDWNIALRTVGGPEFVGELHQRQSAAVNKSIPLRTMAVRRRILAKLSWQYLGGSGDDLDYFTPNRSQIVAIAAANSNWPNNVHPRDFDIEAPWFARKHRLARHHRRLAA